MNEYPRELADKGIDVSVICARQDDTQPVEETIDGVNVYRITSNTSSSVGIEPTRFGYIGLKKVEELCRQEGIDILHMIAFPNLGLIIDSVPWLDAPPVTVADVRGTAVSNVAFEYASRIGITLQDRFVDHTVVIDERVAEKVLSDPSSATIIPIGADFEKFRPGKNLDLRKKWGIGEDEVVFGYTGNIHQSRELDRLVDVFVQLNDMVQQQITLAIVGDGPNFEDLAAYANEHDKANIILTGGVPFHKVPEYVRAFDVGLAYVPSRPQYRDQPPLKTIEFLASGLPVIGTDTPGNQRFIESGENGLLVKDDLNVYTETIREVVEKPDILEEFRNVSRDSVRRFSYYQIVSQQLLPLYRRLLN